MNEVRDLPRTEWRDFLEIMSLGHENDDVTIEIVSHDYGDGIQAEHLPLAALDYDEKNDTVEIAVGGRDGRYPVALRHFIRHPVRIRADGNLPSGAWALDVEDADGTQTIVTLHRPG